MKKIILFTLGLLCLTSFCNLLYADPPLSAHVQYQKDRYILGPNDILALQILHEPDYTQPEILVRPDGYASFPGVGEVKVSGKTIEEISSILLIEYQRTILHPELSLTLKSTRPGTVYLTGAVMHPGMFQFTTRPNTQNNLDNAERLERADMRLSNILSNAGGVKMNADLSNVQITPQEQCQITTCTPISVNLWKLLKEGTLNDDIWVRNGDKIYIPESTVPITNESDYELLLRSSIGPRHYPVRIIGEVQKPGVYQLDGESPLLVSALAQAGGYAPQANRKTVVVRRFSADTQFSTFYLNLQQNDLYLWPNDVVYIPENKLYKTGRFAEQVAKVLSPFTSTAWSGANAAMMFGWGGWK